MRSPQPKADGKAGQISGRVALGRRAVGNNRGVRDVKRLPVRSVRNVLKVTPEGSTSAPCWIPKHIPGRGWVEEEGTGLPFGRASEWQE